MSAGYGPAQVLFDLTHEFRRGTVTALLGPNGAGKSTFARVLTGLIPVMNGRIVFEDNDITRWPAHRVRQAGLVHVPEGRGIFPGLTVLENVQMAVRRAGGRRERSAAVRRVIDIFPVLGERAKQRASSLSGGEQQMLALARAIAIRPQLLVVDEMSLGLAPLVVENVFAVLESVRDEGVAILLIEQFVHRALSLADDSIILVKGRIAWTGPARDAGDEILDRYLGHHTAEEVATTHW